MWRECRKLRIWLRQFLMAVIYSWKVSRRFPSTLVAFTLIRASAFFFDPRSESAKGMSCLSMFLIKFPPSFHYSATMQGNSNKTKFHPFLICHRWGEGKTFLCKSDHAFIALRNRISYFSGSPSPRFCLARLNIQSKYDKLRIEGNLTGRQQLAILMLLVIFGFENLINRCAGWRFVFAGAEESVPQDSSGSWRNVESIISCYTCEFCKYLTSISYRAGISAPSMSGGGFEHIVCNISYVTYLRSASCEKTRLKAETEAY